MNVIFLSIRDNAGVAARLSFAINKYTSWNSRAISRHPAKYGFKNDIVESPDNKNKIKRILQSANVVIWSSSFYNYVPHGIKINKDAKTGIWHGGTRYRTNYKEFNCDVHPKLDYVFMHRDLEGLYKKGIRLQVPFDTNITVPQRDFNTIYVGHSPSNRAMKGTQQFIDGMEMVCDVYDNVKVLMIEKADYNMSVKMKLKCHIFFDQIGGYDIPKHATRGYGASLVEAATFGCALLGWSDYKDTPIMCVYNKENIYDTVSMLIENRKLLQQKMKESRKWAVKEHDSNIIANKFISVLEG